jgi:hypothetical protein
MPDPEDPAPDEPARYVWPGAAEAIERATNQPPTTDLRKLKERADPDPAVLVRTDASDAAPEPAAPSEQDQQGRPDDAESTPPDEPTGRGTT